MIAIRRHGPSDGGWRESVDGRDLMLELQQVEQESQQRQRRHRNLGLGLFAIGAAYVAASPAAQQSLTQLPAGSIALAVVALYFFIRAR